MSLKEGIFFLQVPDHLIFGHNKFNKLRELLEEHFNKFSNQNKSTRAIVFVEVCI